MKTPHKKVSISAKSSRSRIVRFIVLSLIIIAVLVQVALDVLFIRIITSGDRGAVITGLIDSAVTNQTRPVVVGTDGRQYVPMERIVLPAVPNDAYTLHYSTVVDANDRTASDLHLTTSTALHGNLAKLHNAQAAQSNVFDRYDPSKVFETVPALQACSRGYTIRFNGDTSGYDVPVGAVRLADGRTATIGREKLCAELNAATDVYIKQLASY